MDQEIFQRLPAMIALQAFEAAARLKSFSYAANELHLTPSGISRHVQTVQHWYGKKLFSRHGPKVRLTTDGEHLHAALSEALQPLLSLGLAKHTASKNQLLTIYTLPSIAASLLLPALVGFRAAHPHIALNIVSAYTMQSLPPHQASIAVRYGVFDHQGLRTERWLDEAMVPCAHPDWFRQFGNQPNEWPAEQMLQHAMSPWPDRLRDSQGRWQRLRLACGLESNDALCLLQAAEYGLGVIWARQRLALPSVRSKRLQMLPEYRANSERSYWLATRQEMADQAAVVVLWQWLMNTAIDK